MLAFSRSESPDAASCRASRAWRCCRSRVRKSRYWSNVNISSAGLGWTARCATAGQCHHAAADSATAAVRRVHPFTSQLLTRLVAALEQNVIIVAKQKTAED